MDPLGGTSGRGGVPPGTQFSLVNVSSKKIFAAEVHNAEKNFGPPGVKFSSSELRGKFLGAVAAKIRRKMCVFLTYVLLLCARSAHIERTMSTLG